MRKVLTAGLTLATLLLATPASGHEGGAHLMGTVKDITAEHVVLTTKEGKALEIRLVARTRILRGDRTIGPTDVHPGERAVVHSAMHAGRLEASEVRVAKAPK